MQNSIVRFALVALVAGCMVATAGCSAVESVPYPKLGAIKRVKDRFLSKEEKEQQIRELSLEQQTHRSNAEKQLEKR